MNPLTQIAQMAARFAPVDLAADLSSLPDNERRALGALEAAQVIDALFLRQAWSGNETLLLDLARDGSPLGRARLDYFLSNDYYASDVAWMHLDASLEPTIGPYEVDIRPLFVTAEALLAEVAPDAG